MKFNHIRDFLAVAEAGSLRGASRSLGLAQPAITRSIQDFEKSLGAQLFIRGTRGVTLTSVGKSFLPRAQGILQEIRRSRDEVRQMQGAAEGEIVVGLSIAAHMGILERVLRPFTAKFPNIRLRIIEGFLPALENGLTEGSIDLFVGPVLDGKVHPELIFEKLMDNERFVIARRDHPLRDARDLSELMDASWLTTSITHEAWDELRHSFAEFDLPPPTLGGQCQSALSILTLLTNTDMLAMAPRQWVGSAMMGTQIVPLQLKQRFSAPPLMLVYRRGLGLTPAEQVFADLVHRAALQENRE